jgi:hypothetical protein
VGGRETAAPLARRDRRRHPLEQREVGHSPAVARDLARAVDAGHLLAEAHQRRDEGEGGEEEEGLPRRGAAPGLSEAASPAADGPPEEAGTEQRQGDLRAAIEEQTRQLRPGIDAPGPALEVEEGVLDQEIEAGELTRGQDQEDRGAGEEQTAVAAHLAAPQPPLPGSWMPGAAASAAPAAAAGAGASRSP